DLYTVLTRSSLSGWTVAVGVPVAEIESSAKRAVLYSLLGCLAALATGAVFAAVFARRLISSLTGAMGSAFSLGKGETPTPQHARILELDRLHDSLAQAGGVLLQERESRRLVEEQNWHRAHHDMLTGLPNRILFRDRLQQQADRARHTMQSFAVLFIDLDRFKEVNDLLGHDAGDLLLTQAARRIRSHVRQDDMVARLGGDEFTVIVDVDGDGHQAEAVAHGILQELGKPFHIRQEIVHVSGSIGITFYPEDATEPDDLVRNADQAMYTAKNAGRNRVFTFDRTMRESVLQRLNTIADLRNALAGGQFRLYFQPIVDLKDGSIVKAEALLRWFHPQRGLIAPNAFIPLAEETGLINEIGNWVFTEAAAWALKWGNRLGRPFQVSINKSPVQFLNDTHTRTWPEYLSKLGLAGHCISIEITEGLLLNASQSTTAQLDRIERAGINVAIDDFGTGYSSMSYLKKFKVDSLKIDQFFVQDMTSDGNSRTIAETIIVMAHKLGLDVVAEGIETAAQRDWLAASGCDYGQGFFFSEPLPAEAFEALLLSQASPSRAAATGAARSG
ncbi:MAG: putative bifunctional diguanylate cyclase/phosphodiesterase, partial [Burkholderiaceae bacterium]